MTKTYPCEKCGKPRTKAEGGTVFTVCEKCWMEKPMTETIDEKAAGGVLSGLEAACLPNTPVGNAVRAALKWRQERDEARAERDTVQAMEAERDAAIKRAEAAEKPRCRCCVSVPCGAFAASLMWPPCTCGHTRQCHEEARHE